MPEEEKVLIELLPISSLPFVCFKRIHVDLSRKEEAEKRFSLSATCLSDAK
jgi:hypothetical protein